MSSRDNFLAFLSGAAVGAVVALLFAPEKGEVTRRRIRRAVEDGRDRVVDTFEEGRDAVVDAYHRGRERLTEALEEGRERLTGVIEEGRGRLADALDEGREFVDREVKSVCEPVKRTTRTRKS